MRLKNWLQAVSTDRDRKGYNPETKSVIGDEAISAPDVFIEAQVLNLIKKLQRESGVAMQFISHDLGVVRHISDRVAVMLQGEIVEMGTKTQIFEAPQHDYTRTLLSPIPRILPQKEVV